MAEGEPEPALRKRGATPVREERPSEKEIEELRAKLGEARNTIGLGTQPLTTVRLALHWTIDFSIHAVKSVIKSPITWCVVVPLVAAWIGAKQSFAPHLFDGPVCGEKDAAILWWVELAMKETLWWSVLGILSSVGFGTGLHSGLMFLFPHVMQVVGAAESCRTTQGLVPWYLHPCKLDCGTTFGPKDDSTVTMFRLWMLVTVQCMLWGIGTAAGELPPYLVSKAARLAGAKDSEFDQEVAEARSKKDVFSRMKVWTIDFTEKRGFLGVFLLASWPNAAFDMCGMCCGYLLMPFWTFFLACCLGKGVVKVNLQAIFFVNLFGSSFFHVLLSGLDHVNAALKHLLGKDLSLRSMAMAGRAKLVQKFESQSRFPSDRLFERDESGTLDVHELKELYIKHDEPEAIAGRVLQHWDADGDGGLTPLELQAAASRTDGKVSLSSLDPGAGQSLLKIAWELFIVGLIFFFVFSVANQLARSKQAEIDEAEIQRLEKKLKKGDKNSEKEDQKKK